MKTVKIPSGEYNKIIEARKLLVIKGLDGLKPESQELIQQQVNFEKFTLGVIIGIGATLLIQALSEKN